MIRGIASCPYCGGNIALDVTAPRVVFDPDRALSRPCIHLALAWVVLDILRAGPGGASTYVRETSGHWIFEYGMGLRRERENEDYALVAYLIDLYYGQRAPDYLILGIPFRLVGADARAREASATGSGFWKSVDSAGQVTQVELHGWGVYSPDPEALSRWVRRRAGIRSEGSYGCPEVAPDRAQ